MLLLQEHNRTCNQLVLLIYSDDTCDWNYFHVDLGVRTHIQVLKKSKYTLPVTYVYGSHINHDSETFYFSDILIITSKDAEIITSL